MTLRVKNVDYFEWDVPEDLVYLIEDGIKSYQDLIDEHFDVDNIAVAEGADPYYEFDEMVSS